MKKECLDKELKVRVSEYLNLATLFKLQRHVANKRLGQRAAMEIAGVEWEGRQHSGYVDAYNLARLAATMFCEKDTDSTQE